MTFAFNVVTFAMGTGAGGTTFNVAHGLGLEPTGLFLASVNRNDVIDSAGATSAGIMFGQSAGPSAVDNAICSLLNGAQATTDTQLGTRSGYSIMQIDNGPAVLAAAHVSAWDATNVTFTIDDQSGVAFNITMYVWGGTDITNTATGSFQLAGTVSDQDITAPGFTVSDNGGLLILMGCNQSTEDMTGTGMLHSLGFMTAASEQAVWAGGSDNAAAATNSRTFCRSGEILALAGTTSPNIRATASFITNGFRMSVTETGGVQGFLFYLLVKGGQWSLKTGTTQTDTTTDISVAHGFTPAGGIVVSAGRAEDAADTYSDTLQLSIGGYSSTTNRAAKAAIDPDAADPTTTGTGHEFDEVYLNLSSASAMQGLMDIKSVASPALFIMDDADPTGAFFFTVAGAGNAAAGSAKHLLVNGGIVTSLVNGGLVQ